LPDSQVARIKKLPPVKLVIIHYHYRPGGIRRVLELAAPQVCAALGAEKLILAGGEVRDREWTASFIERMKPVPVQVTVEPSFGYVSEQHHSARHLRRQVRAALNRLFDGASARDCIVWAHNLGVGRNLILNQELTRACAPRKILVISHHHDWWFDNRWLRWPEMKRFGARTMRATALTTFPPVGKLRHATINRADSTVIQRHLPGRAGWLPNPVERNTRPALARKRAARRWLDEQLEEHAALVWIVPCRMLRRKNIAEAWLLARWLRPEAWLVTTGGVSSADERPYFQKLNAAARKHRWRLRLGLLATTESRKPVVPELVAASECVLLTSLQEGFGLPYLEAAAAQRPLIARSLPNIAPDLHEFGFRFPQGYDELLVHADLFDWKAERARQQKLFGTWRQQLPRALRKFVGLPVLLATTKPPWSVPFSRLTLTAQLEVLAQPTDASWKLCAPLNTFLESWRLRAAAGRLQISPWPRQADQWLSGKAYAARFREICHAANHSAKPAAAQVCQLDLMKRRLAAEFLYPLLWDRVT